MREQTFLKFIFLFLVVVICSIFSFNGLGYAVADAYQIDLEANPGGVAINPVTNIAVVVNMQAGSVSIVDLDTQAVLSSIPVGWVPKETAIDTALNQAVISNNHDNTISIIDLNSHQVITTLPVGKGPEGIAVNPFTHLALTANRKDNSVSVIDLTTYRIVRTISTGKEPVNIAIDPEFNLALIVNEKDYTVSVIDLDTYHVTGLIPVGKKPGVIDINPETHLAVVANEKDDSITVIDLKSWASHVIPVGKHPVGVTINPLDNRALVVCDEDRTMLLVDPGNNSILKVYALNKLPRGVAVNNLTNVTAIADDKTDSLTLIQLPNPIPQIASINPNNILRGSKSSNITIAGAGFIKSSFVSFQNITSQALQTDFIDNHSLRAAIPEELLQKSGTYQIAVTNPSPEGGESNSVILNINNPLPSIFMLEPAEAIAGTQGLTLTLYGTGIFDDTEVYFGSIKKPITYINSTKLQIYLTPEDLKTPGLFEITAHNSSPGGGDSNKLIFTIKNPLEIKITSPSDGETINKAKIIVKGTVKSDTKDIGITVNGTIAEITGNEWIANNVPLTVGSNIITATATDSTGNTDTKAITVTTDDTAQPLELSANITSGIAPLTTYFSASSSTFTPVSYQMDFEGDGIVDYTGSTFEDITHTYTTEGVFYPIITVSDKQGNIYSDTIAITAMNKTEIDALLKGKWEGMKGAMATGDINEALNYFAKGSREEYREIFGLLVLQFPSLVSGMREITMIEVVGNVAEYYIKRLQRGVDISYFIYFMKDEDGTWRIYGF